MAIDSVTGVITPDTTTSVGGLNSRKVDIPEAKDQYGKDTFLKLLVAQLRYQDPTNPTDSAQFLAQTAQFTTVEKLNEMAKLNTELLAAQRMVGASSMIGRTVTYQDADGLDHTGQVAGAKITEDGPLLRIGEDYVKMADVREIAVAGELNPSAPPAKPAPTSPEASASV